MEIFEMKVVLLFINIRRRGKVVRVRWYFRKNFGKKRGKFFKKSPTNSLSILQIS